MDHPANPPAAENVAAFAADTLAAQMLQAIVTELAGFQARFSDLNEHQQNAAIEHLRARVRAMIAEALGILFRADYPACLAELESITFRDGITAKLTIAKAAEHRHELADRVGQTVVVIMADSTQYLAGLDDIRAKAQQGELFDGASAGVELNPPGGSVEIEDTQPTEPLELAPEELEIDEHAISEQLRDAGILVEASAIETWTREQCVETLTWLHALRKNLTDIASRPFYLPAPTNPGPDGPEPEGDDDGPG